MPKQAVKTHQRVGKDGTRHTVRRHARDVPGARQAGSSFNPGFKPMTPARATCGALVGSAAYWTFSGAMQLITLVGFSLTTAVVAIMGYDAVKKKTQTRKRATGKRSVTRLRAKVAVSNAKQKARTKYKKTKVFLNKRQERQAKWRKHVRKMPLGRRFNPSYRVKRWWKFRMGEYKVAARNRVDGWIEKTRAKVYKGEKVSVRALRSKLKSARRR